MNLAFHCSTNPIVSPWFYQEIYEVCQRTLWFNFVEFIESPIFILNTVLWNNHANFWPEGRKRIDPRKIFHCGKSNLKDTFLSKLLGPKTFANKTASTLHPCSLTSILMRWMLRRNISLCETNVAHSHQVQKQATPHRFHKRPIENSHNFTVSGKGKLQSYQSIRNCYALVCLKSLPDQKRSASTVLNTK